MNQFLKSLHSTRAVLVFFIALLVSFFVVPPIFQVLEICFLAFTVHALLTTPTANKGLKIFLWCVLAVVAATIMWEVVYNYFIVGRGNNALSRFVAGFTILIALPPLLIGLARLFKSEQRSASN